MSEPVRTCVGCGERAAKAALLRMVAGTDGLRLDRALRAPGRGAYLHPTSSCWTAFARRRGSIRSLRLNPGADERERLVAALVATAVQDAR